MPSLLAWLQPLGFAAPWRPDCHTNLFYDAPLRQYIMTTRSYADPNGRLISIARTNASRRGRDVFVKNGSWSDLYHNEYPPAAAVPGGSGCFTLPDGSRTAAGCAAACDKTPSCRYFWTYTGGKKGGTCCMKTAIRPGPLEKPACPSCGGIFAAMDGKLVRVNASEFVRSGLRQTVFGPPSPPPTPCSLSPAPFAALQDRGFGTTVLARTPHPVPSADGRPFVFGYVLERSTWGFRTRGPASPSSSRKARGTTSSTPRSPGASTTSSSGSS